MAGAFKLVLGNSDSASNYLNSDSYRPHCDCTNSREFQINEISINDISSRPLVRVNLHGRSIPFLYDTGADCSVISRATFQNIPQNNRPHKMRQDFSLKSASKNSLKIDGRYLMNVEVANKRLLHPIFVCENLTQPAIMGMDLINKLGLNFNCINKQFTIEKDDTAVVISTLSAESIPPLTAQPIRVRVQNQSKIDRSRTGVAWINSVRYPLLSGGPGLVDLNSEYECTVLLKNCSPVTIEIDRGESIGNFEQVNAQPIEITTEKLVNNLTKIAKPRRPALTADRRKEFLTDLNLTVPEAERKAYTELLLENFDVFSKTKLDLGTANNFEHRITLSENAPSYIKQFRIPEAHREALVEQVQDWLKLGIIEPANSRFNSPIFVVPKKDGTMRFVLDFRALNARSHDDRYTMKDVSECIGDIGRAGSHIFSTLDLTAGFWQMPLDPKSRPYTAFTIPGLGQFQWTRGAMGLKGCPGSFQRLVELAVKGIPNIIVYIDDLLVHSSSHSEHRKLLAQLFQRLRQVGLKANLKKCEFGATNVSYLGFRLTPEGILPGKDKLQAIRDAKPPKTVTEIRQFLGLCNFFRTHVPNFAQISAPLTQLTCKAREWKNGILPPEAQRAFETLRQALISEPVVAYPRRNRPYSLIVDAATGGEGIEGGMGAILCQTDEQGRMRAIAYASRGLQKHEKNYTPFLAEMMAAVWGMKHFDVYLRGRHFTLYTDHRPLEKLGKVHTKTLNRLQEAMNEFDFTIVYKKGSEMPADFLSRNINAVEIINEISESEIAHPELMKEQNADPFCSAVLNFIKRKQLPSDANLARLVKKIGPEAFLKDGILWRRLSRPGFQEREVIILPKSIVPDIIHEAHGTLLTGHGGMTQTKERILAGFYWPNMESEILQMLQKCVKCQFSKTKDRPGAGLLHPLPQCTNLNQRIHCDLFGPLRTSEQGKKYILCMTDAFTKLVELVAVPNKEVTTVTSAIFNRWICRYGVPLELVTDQGKEFCAELADKLYEKLKVKHTTTTPAHPQCNAQAEVANKTIAKYLTNVVDSSTLDWEPYLPPLAFSYNTAVHRTTKMSPYFLTYGRDPRLPGLGGAHEPVDYGEDPVSEWLKRLNDARRLAEQNSWTSNEKYKDYHDEKHKDHKYVVGQQVLVDVRNFLGKNRKLAPNWEGPYEIVRLWDNGVVDVRTPKRDWRINIQRIKPFFNSLHVSDDKAIPNEHDRVESEAEEDPWADGIPVMIQPETPGPPPTATQPQRSRGRPRKIAAPAETPNNNHATSELNLPDRLTRAKARALERAGMPVPLATGLINSINSQVIDRLLKRGVTLAQINVPMQTKEQWIKRRQQFLNRLNPQARNLLLTGDPLFAFDPVIYEYVITTPPAALPPLIGQQLGYLSPPGSPHPSPPPSPVQTPPPSPVQTPPPSPVPSPQVTPEQSPRHSPHTSTPGTPDSFNSAHSIPEFVDYNAWADDELHDLPVAGPSPHNTSVLSLPDLSLLDETTFDFQDFTPDSPFPRPANPTPARAQAPLTTRQKNKTLKDIDDTANLFSRLSTDRQPGGHHLRTEKKQITQPRNPFKALTAATSCPTVKMGATMKGLDPAAVPLIRSLRPPLPPPASQSSSKSSLTSSTGSRPPPPATQQPNPPTPPKPTRNQKLKSTKTARTPPAPKK